MRYVVLLAAIGFSVSSCGSNSGTVFEVLDDEYLCCGFVAYAPPMDAHGPGWVYEYVQTDGGGIAQRTICNNLYSGTSDLARPSNVSLPSGTSKLNFQLGVHFQALQGLIYGVTPGIDKDFVYSRTADLEWSGLTAWEIPSDAQYDENGKVVRITNQCAAALRARRDSNGRVRNVFVVFESIKADTTTLTIDWDSGQVPDHESATVSQKNEQNNLSAAEQDEDSGLSLSVDGVFEFSADAARTSQNSRTLTFSNPRYIGYKAITLDRFLPAGAFGDARAEVSGRKLDKVELEDTVRSIISEAQ